jgi:ADP-heptose:LPS heptosyltransferase/glycosyltransferase involved in cell wall biosynthesis
MSSKIKLKDLGRKPKILWVNEASFLRTGFSTIGWQVLKRLQATGKYDIVELGSYASQEDPRWKDARWGINWKYYGVLPDQNNPQEQQEYQQGYHFNQFGKWKFDEVLLKEKPDIVIDIRDRWMASEWQLKSSYRKYFTYIYMPCVDSHPPMPEWVKDYKESDYILGYSHYAKRVLEIEGVKCHGVANPGVDTSVFYPTTKMEARARWGLRKDIKPILCVHRNQKRKLLPDMIYSYLILKNESPEAFKNTVLWFHTSWPDVGFNIPVTMDRAKQGRMPFKDAKGKLKEKRFKKGLKYADVVFSYICHACGHTFVSPYVNGMAAVRDVDTNEQRMDELKCDLIYCQKCGKKEARMPNTQLGFDPEDFADVYRAAYVHVQPAIAGADEMPMNEAKACGTPVLAPVHAAMHEKVEQTDYCPDDRWKGGMPINLDALYTEAETMQHRCIFSKEHLAKQLNKILTDSSLHKRLCTEASEVVRKYYDWDNIAKVWDDLLWDTVEVNSDVEKGWRAPAKLKEYAEFSVPTMDKMDNPTFIKWCYNHFLHTEPDAPGFQYWMEDMGRGRDRANVVAFFKQEADAHNKRELIRTGAEAAIAPPPKITDYMDPKDTFRIIVVMPGTAGDLHLLTGTIKSLYEKYNRQEPWGIYVACEDRYHDILKGISFIKGLLPYSVHIDNAKGIEQAKICNIAYTPHIATQLREHYVHRGYGRHLGHVYADMCGVEFGTPVIAPVKIDRLPSDYYVLHCKTSMKSKDWPIERFKSLVRLFPDVQFVQIGAPTDTPVNEPNVLDLRGQTTFRQMAYVIKKAEGIIGLDSVALHVASTVGTKSLGIFASTYPNICGPLNSHGGGVVVPDNRPDACPEPCHMIECPSKASPCIQRVTVRQIASAMEQIFGDE